MSGFTCPEDFVQKKSIQNELTSVYHVVNYRLSAMGYKSLLTDAWSPSLRYTCRDVVN